MVYGLLKVKDESQNRIGDIEPLRGSIPKRNEVNDGVYIEEYELEKAGEKERFMKEIKEYNLKKKL